MSDLVKRLKVAAEDFPIITERPDKLLFEAADRIEELEALRTANRELIADMEKDQKSLLLRVAELEEQLRVSEHNAKFTGVTCVLHLKRIKELKAELKLVSRNYDTDVSFWQQTCAELNPKIAALYLDAPKVSDTIAELEAKLETEYAYGAEQWVRAELMKDKHTTLEDRLRERIPRLAKIARLPNVEHEADGHNETVDWLNALLGKEKQDG